MCRENTIKWSEDGSEEISSSEVAIAIGMVFTMLIYMFIFVYGAQVMSSVVQEKTNRADAYMFGRIIEELLKTDRDIFKIISTAGFGGRG